MELESVGEQIKARREALGMTRSALAERAQVDRGRLGKIEDGTAGSPRSSTIGLILRTLDDLEEEFGEDGTDYVTITVDLPGEMAGRVTVKGRPDGVAEAVADLLRRMDRAGQESP
ncbi:MAG: helix-turn-helix domain-containing protein [Nocardioidaceae bacterium]